MRLEDQPQSFDGVEGEETGAQIVPTRTFGNPIDTPFIEASRPTGDRVLVYTE